MPGIKQAQKALASRILEGEGKASSSDRRAAFNNSGLAEPAATLVDKVAKNAYRVTDEDIAAARDSGSAKTRSLRSWCARLSARPDRQYDTALASLEAATEKECVRMRLRILDSGHGFSSKTLFGVDPNGLGSRCWT